MDAFPIFFMQPKNVKFHDFNVRSDEIVFNSFYLEQTIKMFNQP